tara:strand:- start:2815 stop:3204 length:390 start_codon:yes stop_codon:yes gene_type:complete
MLNTFDITPFKNRYINLNKKVYVYRCLNKPGYIYSIKQFGKVVGHTSNLILSDVNFKIVKSGKEKAIETNVRNVHALINGYITDCNKSNNVIGELKYYPFCQENFQCNNKEIKKCNKVTIDNNKLFCYD